LKDVGGLPPNWTDALPGQAKRLPVTGYELPDCRFSTLHHKYFQPLVDKIMMSFLDKHDDTVSFSMTS